MNIPCVYWLFFSHIASSHGHLQCVKFLLRQPGVDIHARDRWRTSPLSGKFFFSIKLHADYVISTTSFQGFSLFNLNFRKKGKSPGNEVGRLYSSVPVELLEIIQNSN